MQVPEGGRPRETFSLRKRTVFEPVFDSQKLPSISDWWTKRAKRQPKLMLSLKCLINFSSGNCYLGFQFSSRTSLPNLKTNKTARLSKFEWKRNVQIRRHYELEVCILFGLSVMLEYRWLRNCVRHMRRMVLRYLMLKSRGFEHSYRRGTSRELIVEGVVNLTMQIRKTPSSAK